MQRIGITDDVVHRIQRVELDHDESEQEKKRRRKVQYRGRLWQESDEELPFQPPSPTKLPSKVDPKTSLLNNLPLRRARFLFDHLVTLEELVGQLIVCTVETDYDRRLEKQLETVMIEYQVGGLLFLGDNVARHDYFCSLVLELSKTPPFLVNSLEYSLAVLQNQTNKEEVFPPLHPPFPKSLQGQLVDPLSCGKKLDPQSQEKWYRYLRGKGVAIGYLINQRQKNSESGTAPSFWKRQTSERSIFFKDCRKESWISTEMPPLILSQDTILVVESAYVSEAIQAICHAVRKGEVPLKEIEERVLRLLYLKTQSM